MKSLKPLWAIALALPLATTSVALADEAHLSDVAQSNPQLAEQYQSLLKPFMGQSEWLANYGTTAPGTQVSLDDTKYVVYWGCKPHDCVSENYAILVEANSQKLVAGAFVRNHFKEQTITHSNISWLGNAQLDEARTLAPFLY